MAYNLKNKLVIAVSSRALFDLEDENSVFEKNGLKAYYKYQLKKEHQKLKRGAAFGFIKNLLRINKKFDDKLIEVIILSRNNAATGLRIQKSIENYGLDIKRAAWTAGRSTSHYLKAFEVDLFISAHESDVQEAINKGIASARIIPKKYKKKNTKKDVHIAFDGDAVLFSDESEKIYQQHGLDAFLKHEKKNVKNPLPKGPFAKLLKVISEIQQRFPIEESPIKTALITARNFETFERVIRTFNTWNVRVDEAFFLGGVEKSKIVKAFQADIFFDDQDVHLDKTSKNTPSAKVPYKKKNNKKHA